MERGQLKSGKNHGLMKSNLKKKVSPIRISQIATSGGPPVGIKISTLEKGILLLLGKTAQEGFDIEE